MTLSITINLSEPIALKTYAKSMAAIANDYDHCHLVNPEQKTDLYIKEIRSGSIITELAPLVPLAGNLISHIDSIKSYAEYLSASLRWLLNHDERPQYINKKHLHNVSNILEPVARDSGAQMNIGTINVQGDVHLHFSLDSQDANFIQNKVRREMGELLQVNTGHYSQVVMYWEQVAIDKPKDRAIVESIYSQPVKTILPKSIKDEILISEAYPFSKAFVVDVWVETIEGIPKLYKILEYYYSIDK